MLRRRYCFCVLCAIAMAIVAWLAMEPTAAHAQAPAGPVSYIRDIAPIFKENCYACHDAKKRNGKFEMTSYATLRHGGTNDDPIAPGKPDDSYLMELLTTEGAKLMPPKDKGGPLSKEQIATVERWIKEGAKLDAGIAADADILRELRKRWQPPKPPEKYPFPAIVNAMAFTPDGAMLVVGGYHELTVWEVATGKLAQRIRTRAERAYAMQMLPTGELAVAGGRPGQEGDLCIYNLSGAGEKRNGVLYRDGSLPGDALRAKLLETDDALLALAISPDGKSLAVGGCDRTIRVWNVAGGAKAAKLSQAFDIHADWILGLAYSADGNRLLSASRDKTAKSYDLAKKEMIANYPEHQAPVFAALPRKDGKTALSVGADKSLRIWNFAEPAQSNKGKAIGGHTEEITKLIALPNQGNFATASADKSVRIWKDDGSALRSFSGLGDVIYSLALSPDGTVLAAGSYNGSVQLWKLPDGTALRSFIAAPGFAK